jgi:Cytochrome c554 and c-prime
MTARAFRTRRPLFAASLTVLGTLGMLACQRPAPAPPTPPPPAPPAPPARDAAPPAPAPRAAPTFSLVYSSDLRGRITPRQKPLNLPPGVSMTPLAHRETSGGLGRRATIVDRARVDAGGVVQVDAGDFLPTPADDPRDAVAPDAKDVPRWLDLVLASYRRLGVDAVTLGERELAPADAAADPKRLAKKLAAARVPVVVANLVGRKGALVFPASILVDAGGAKVGVLGVTELDADATAALGKGGYALTPPDAAARAAAKDLRARGATFVVALVHAASGRARAAAIVAGDVDIDVAVLALGHDAGSAPGPAPRALARPRLLAAGGDLAVGRLDVRAGAGGPAVLDDAVVDLPKTVPEQLGVGLLSRAARIPLIDTDKMQADAKRKHVQIKLRDLYEIWDYGSTKACSYCHPKPIAQWDTTDHAHAFATLVKAKHDRDPNCLGCHVIGFLQPAGTRDLVMARGQFANVGCEGCHGPSAPHVRSVNKKQGTVRDVSAVVCLGCHTPDQNIGPFDPIAAMKEILGPGHGAPDAPAPVTK